MDAHDDVAALRRTAVEQAVRDQLRDQQPRVVEHGSGDVAGQAARHDGAGDAGRALVERDRHVGELHAPRRRGFLSRGAGLGSS